MPLTKEQFDELIKAEAELKQSAKEVEILTEVREYQCTQCRYIKSCEEDDYFCPTAQKLAELSF